ncbi:MAG TPA: DUF881 domain-containing protein [Mycobacteriales bacterium]|nr:DUF881 domain-containing protein [Mycobacteriales bacterium]
MSEQERSARRGPGLWRRLLRPRLRGVDLLVAVLLALLGFAAAVQVRSTQDDPALVGARQEDLVQILDELANRNDRLRGEIDDLTDARERLTSGSDTTEAALEEARRRAQVLGILAGTVPAEGPGVTLLLRDPDRVLGADVLLDALQELRDAGAEAVQLEGPVGQRGELTPSTEKVRVVVSTSLLDTDEGVIVDGTVLRPPYRFVVVGDAGTLASALRIPGGVVATVEQRGGTALVEQREALVVDALRPLDRPQYARPAEDD